MPRGYNPRFSSKLEVLKSDWGLVEVNFEYFLKSKVEINFEIYGRVLLQSRKQFLKFENFEQRGDSFEIDKIVPDSKKYCVFKKNRDGNSRMFLFRMQNSRKFEKILILKVISYFVPAFLTSLKKNFLVCAKLKIWKICSLWLAHYTITTTHYSKVRLSY